MSVIDAALQIIDKQPPLSIPETTFEERRNTSTEGQATRAIVDRILAALTQAGLTISLKDAEFRAQTNQDLLKKRTDNLLTQIIKSDPFLAIYQQLRNSPNKPLFVYKLGLTEPSLKRLNDQLLGPQITDQFLHEIGEEAKALFEKEAQQISKKGKSYYFANESNQSDSLMTSKKQLEIFALRKYQDHLNTVRQTLLVEITKMDTPEDKKTRINGLIELIDMELKSPQVGFDLSFVEIPPTNNENRAHLADQGLFQLELASKNPKEEANEPKTYNLTDNLQAVFASYYQLLNYIKDKYSSATDPPTTNNLLLDPSSTSSGEWSGLTPQAISQVRKSTPTAETNSHELQLAQSCLHALNGIEIFRPYLKDELAEYAKFAEKVCELLDDNSKAATPKEIGQVFERAEELARKSTKVTPEEHTGLSDYGYTAKFLEFYEGQPESRLLTIFLDRIGLAADNYTKIQETLGNFITVLTNKINAIDVNQVPSSLQEKIKDYQSTCKRFHKLAELSQKNIIRPNMQDIEQFFINFNTLELLASNFKEVIALVDPTGDLLKNFELEIATCTEKYTAGFRDSVDQISATLASQGLDPAVIYTGGDEVRITMPLPTDTESEAVLDSIQKVINDTSLRAAAVINTLPKPNPDQIAETEKDLTDMLREIAIALAKIIEQGDLVINALKTNPQDLIPICTLGTPKALAS